MHYKDLALDEPILTQEEAKKLGERHEKPSQDSSNLEKDAIKIGGSIIGVVSNFAKNTKYPSLDNETANDVLKAAKNVATDEKTQEKVKQKAKELANNAVELGKNAKEAIKDHVDIDKFSTDALALFFLFLETLPPLVFLVVNKVFLLLSIVLSFFVLIAVGVIIVCYLLIKKYKDSLKDSTSAIVLEIVLSVTEGILIVTFSIAGEDAFIAGYMILAVSLLCTSIFADHLKHRYTDKSGIRVAMVMAINTVFVLFNVLNTNLIECGIAAAVTYLYLIFAIFTLHEVVKESNEENSKKAASFATLIVYERKVELIYRGVMWLVRFCQNMNEKRKNLSAEKSLQDPLIEKKSDSNKNGEKPEKSKAEKPEKLEKVEKPEKGEKSEKPEKKQSENPSKSKKN